jgi:uncharacterized protein YutE (UPF0331/DUF86 family)
MVLRREAIEERLKELDEILQELTKYRGMTWEEFQADLGQRWIVERGLIAAASVIFDIANHILAGHFGVYAETYEENLAALRDKGVVSQELYQQIRGLGGFRNILIHRYLDIDPREVFENFGKGLAVFPGFAQEVLTWLEELGED